MQDLIQQTDTDLAIDFLSSWPAWWFWAAAVVLLPAMWLVLRPQARSLPRRWAHILLALRLLTVVCFLLLIFKPRLVLQQSTRYGGRVAVVVDNSRSMSTRDVASGPAELLAHARRTGRTAPANPAFDALGALRNVRFALRRLAELQTGEFTARDEYWSYIERKRPAVQEDLDTISEVLPPEQRGILREAADLFRATVSDPAATVEQTGRVRGGLLDLQAALVREECRIDSERYAQSQAASSVLEEMASWSRLRLSGELAREHLAAIGNERFEWQRFDVRPLNPTPDTGEGAEAGARGSTAVAEALRRVLNEEHPMPLSTVMLISDGRWTRREGLNKALREFEARALPVHAFGVGSESEPTDLAVLEILAPEFAVAGEETRLRCRLKASLPEDAGEDELSVRLRLDGEQIAAAEFSPGTGAASPAVDLRFALEKAGPALLTAEIAEREWEMSGANNSASVRVEVLPEPIRVLYLEQRPRWQARFTAGILQRLPYVRVNRPVVLTAPERSLIRGGGRGEWPEDREGLGLYDLLILGDVPPDMLTDVEWTMIDEAVRAGELTLILSSGNRYLPATYGEHPLSDFLSYPTVSPEAASPARWKLTPAGRLSRMTASWADFAATGEFTGRASGIVLANAGEPEVPLVSWRPRGDGRIVTLHHPALWRSLKGERTPLRTEFWIQIVNWSRQMGTLNAGGPRFVAERPRVDPGAPLVTIGSYPGRITFRHEESDFEKTVSAREIGNGFYHHVLPAVTYANVEKPGGQWTAEAGGTTARFHVSDTDAELGFIGRDDAALGRLAAATGGSHHDIGRLEAPLPDLEGKTRTSIRRRQWDLWSHLLTLFVVAGLMTAEWLWRKRVGKV